MASKQQCKQCEGLRKENQRIEKKHRNDLRQLNVKHSSELLERDAAIDTLRRQQKKEGNSKKVVSNEKTVKYLQSALDNVNRQLEKQDDQHKKEMDRMRKEMERMRRLVQIKQRREKNGVTTKLALVDDIRKIKTYKKHKNCIKMIGTHDGAERILRNVPIVEASVEEEADDKPDEVAEDLRSSAEDGDEDEAKDAVDVPSMHAKSRWAEFTDDELGNDGQSRGISESDQLQPPVHTDDAHDGNESDTQEDDTADDKDSSKNAYADACDQVTACDAVELREVESDVTSANAKDALRDATASVRTDTDADADGARSEEKAEQVDAHLIEPTTTRDVDAENQRLKNEVTELIDLLRTKDEMMRRFEEQLSNQQQIHDTEAHRQRLETQVTELRSKHQELKAENDELLRSSTVMKAKMRKAQLDTTSESIDERRMNDSAEELHAEVKKVDDRLKCWEFNSIKGCKRGNGCWWSHMWLTEAAEHPWTREWLPGCRQRIADDPGCIYGRFHDNGRTYWQRNIEYLRQSNRQR